MGGLYFSCRLEIADGAESLHAKPAMAPKAGEKVEKIAFFFSDLRLGSDCARIANLALASCLSDGIPDGPMR